MREPKSQPTQKVLGNLYDEVDKLTDYALVLFLALGTPSMGEDANASASLAGDMSDRLRKTRDTLHDLVAWV